MSAKVIVTTGDLKQAYEILGPVCYMSRILTWATSSTDDGSTVLDKWFPSVVEELKRRASLLGADAVICMRQVIAPSAKLSSCHLYMYGTAVRMTGFKDSQLRGDEEQMPQPGSTDTDGPRPHDEIDESTARGSSLGFDPDPAHWSEGIAADPKCLECDNAETCTVLDSSSRKCRKRLA
jgi:hypothetical protein